jgi:hypothetical protein
MFAAFLSKYSATLYLAGLKPFLVKDSRLAVGKQPFYSHQRFGVE